MNIETSDKSKDLVPDNWKDKCILVVDDMNVNYEIEETKEKETNLLLLDSSKARKLLNWNTLFSIDKTLEKTFEWYKMFAETRFSITDRILEEYLKEQVIQNGDF